MNTCSRGWKPPHCSVKWKSMGKHDGTSTTRLVSCILDFGASGWVGWFAGLIPANARAEGTIYIFHMALIPRYICVGPGYVTADSPPPPRFCPLGIVSLSILAQGKSYVLTICWRLSLENQNPPEQNRETRSPKSH